MHDAWGVSNRAFEHWFLIAATIVVMATIAYRFVAFRGRRHVGDDIDADHVAFLADGPRLAVFSALGELRDAGVVGVGPDRALTRNAPLPVSATQLARSVYDAAAGARTGAELRGHTTVATTLARIREGLSQAGLLLSPSQRAANRWFVYAELAVVATGVARLAADLAIGAPVGDLLRAFVLIGLFLLYLLAVPTRTRAGTAVLRDMRRRYADLAPSRKPSHRADGAGGAAMGIALFGVASLYALDPAFAADVGAPRPVRRVSFG